MVRTMLLPSFVRIVAPLAIAHLACAPIVAQCVNISIPQGSGCGYVTPFGIPVASCNGAPSIGNASFGFTTTAPCLAAGNATAGLLLIGLCLPAPIAITTGFGPGGVCGPSQALCALYVNVIGVAVGVAQAGGFAFPTPVPNDPGLVGLQLCVQGANVCSGGPCVSATQGVRVTLF